MKGESFKTIRGLIDVFDQAARACRTAKGLSEEHLKRLRQAYEAAQAEIERLKAGGHTKGIRVFYLPEFGYPELYMRRVLDEFPALPQAQKNPG